MKKKNRKKRNKIKKLKKNKKNKYKISKEKEIMEYFDNFERRQGAGKVSIDVTGSRRITFLLRIILQTRKDTDTK